MEAIEAGLDGIEHVTSFGLTLIPKMEGENSGRLCWLTINARKNGRYEVWSKIDVNGKMADSLLKFRSGKKHLWILHWGPSNIRKQLVPQPTPRNGRASIV
jgi:hypothetical protein